MEQIIINFIDFLKQFSYFGVIMALTFEFIPAELVLPLVGYWVYQGDMHMLGAIITGAIGGTFGPLTLYALGKYGGRPMVLKYGKYFFITEKHIFVADQFFEKHGPVVALLGRFIPGVRTAISLPCGITNMNIWVFTIYTFIGILPITILYIYLGYLLGSKWKEVGQIIEPYLLPVSFLLIGSFVIYVLWTRRKK